MTDLVTVVGFLDRAALERVSDEMRAAAGAASTVSGGGAAGARRSTRLAVSEATSAAMIDLLERRRASVAGHFARTLETVEEPQFLRYGPGDYFVAHQDGNTPLLHDDSRFRRVSAVIFLSDPELDHSGGALVLDPFGERRELAPAPGTLVAFPSETTHEVVPVTAGERLTIVSWYRGGEG